MFSGQSPLDRIIYQLRSPEINSSQQYEQIQEIR
jgi:hypothetical protein